MLRTLHWICRRQIIVTMSKSSRLDASDLPLANILRKDVLWLCNVFTQKGYEIRIVGGAVRDLLMGREAKDIDLSTTARPHEMIEVFNENNIRYIETGLQHGTLTAHVNGCDFEVTTLRIDVETDGRHAKVQFTTDWKLDALRRDLTVNAMSLDVNGVLYDYFDGENHLKEGKVCFVGDAKSRIREDYLRILRYFRFYGRIAPDTLQHDGDTLSVIRAFSNGMAGLAVERVWSEISRILVGNFAPHLLRLMYELDVAKNIGLPDCDENHFQLFDAVWSQSRNVKLSPITLLVTLLNSKSDAERFCLKWKLSNNERNLALFIVNHRDVPENSTLKTYKDLIVSVATPEKTRFVFEYVVQLLYYQGKFDQAEQLKNWAVPKFPVNGSDLKQLGIKPGPAFGKTLTRLKRIWMESGFNLSKELLLKEVES